MFAPLRVVRLGMCVLFSGVLTVGLVGCTNSERASTQPASAQAAPSVIASASRSYVGTATGTAAFVSVVVDGSRALGYVCDGVPAEGAPGTAPTIQLWFNGTSDGRSVDVTQPQGRLQVQLTDSAMTGTVTLADGRSLPVTGSAVDGIAGLYRAQGANALAGWIVASDAQQRGALQFEPGGGLGIPRLTLKASTLNAANLPPINLPNLPATQVQKVGITPIPIP